MTTKLNLEDSLLDIICISTKLNLLFSLLFENFPLNLYLLLVSIIIDINNFTFRLLSLEEYSQYIESLHRLNLNRLSF